MPAIVGAYKATRGNLGATRVQYGPHVGPDRFSPAGYNGDAQEATGLWQRGTGALTRSGDRSRAARGNVSAHARGGGRAYMKPTNAHLFGALLKQYRIARALTQEALAERAGISVRTIKGMERGEPRLPRADTLTRIITALDLPPQEDAALWSAARSTEQPSNSISTSTARDVLTLGGTGMLTSLIGREDIIQGVLSLLGDDGTRLLTLVGPPGVGKTRIGLEVAQRIATRAAAGGADVDRVVCAALASVPVPALVVPTIAQAMGIHEAQGRTLIESLAAAVRDSRTLLVLDNLEHLRDAAADLVRVLAHCPQVKMLVTSRAALRLRAERELPVPPLPVPAVPMPVEELRQVPSVALFVQRTQAIVPSFELDETNAATIAQICRRVDGVPLALELAAARCRLLSPRALLTRLASQLPLLADRTTDLPPRHQTMRDAIAWSYQLLSDREQFVFRQLAVFADGCSVEAAVAVCGRDGGGDEDAHVMDDLTTLAAHSLIGRIDGEDGDDGGSSLTMLHSIREYALEWLERAGERTAAAYRHCAYYCSYAEALSERATERGSGFSKALVEQEYANLRAALAWAIEHDELVMGERLIAQLWRYWYTRGMLTEGRRWAEALLAKVGDADQCWVRCFPPAPATCSAAGIGSVAGQAAGPTEGTANDSDAADACGGAASAHLAAVLNGAGMLAFRQGDYVAATTWLERSLALHRWRGDTQSTAAVLNNLGIVAADQGHYVQAQRLHTESLALKRTLGRPQDVAVSLSNLGCVARAQGQFALARTYFEENLAMQRAGGDAYRLAHAIGNLGTLAYAEEECDEAVALYEECLQLQRELADTQGIALSHLNLCEVLAAGGNVTEALLHGRESLRMFRTLGEQTRIASALTLLASLSCLQGETTQAVEYLHESLDLYRHLGPHRTAPMWAVTLARLAHEQGLHLRAAQLLAAAQSLRTVRGATWMPAEQRQRDLLMSWVREALTDDVVRQAWDEATMWTWDELLASAQHVLVTCGTHQRQREPEGPRVGMQRL